MAAPKGSYRASFANTDAKGIEPRDEYQRKIFNLSLNQNITDKLKLSVNINWSNEIQSNPPAVGTQGSGSVNFFTRLAISTPGSAYKNSAVNPTNGTEAQTSGFQGTVLNPYHANQAGQNWVNNRDRILGTATLRYEFTKWLFLQGRCNYNYSISSNESKFPYGIGTSVPTNADGTYKGSYNVSESKGSDVNADFLLGANREIGKFSIDANFGGNTLRSEGHGLNQNSRITGGDVAAKTYYESAITADMDTYLLYTNGTAVSAAAKATYVADPAVLYNSTNALKLINTQYWVVNIGNGTEAWSNFRRSGFPALSPNLFNNNLKGGFIRRLSYPDYESSNNKTNYFTAVQAIGGTDNLTTRIFWDK